MGAAQIEKSRYAPLYCHENGRYYTSEKKMQYALRQSKEKKGKKIKCNRKRRCLINGRMYVTKGTMRGSFKIAAKKRNSLRNRLMLAEWAKHQGDPEVNDKRQASLAKYPSLPELYKKWRSDPDVKQFYRELIELIYEMRGHVTDKDNADILSHKLKTHRDGEQCIEIQECERESSVGVLHIEDLEEEEFQGGGVVHE